MFSALKLSDLCSTYTASHLLSSATLILGSRNTVFIWFTPSSPVLCIGPISLASVSLRVYFQALDSVLLFCCCAHTHTYTHLRDVPLLMALHLSSLGLPNPYL